MKPTLLYKFMYGTLVYLDHHICQNGQGGVRLHTIIKATDDYCAVMEFEVKGGT